MKLAIYALKRLAPFAAILFGAMTVYGQSASTITGVVFSRTGQPIPGAKIRVCSYNATGAPCSPLSTLYNNIYKSTTIANPTQTDSYGNFSLYVASGAYLVQVFESSTLLWSQTVQSNAPYGGSGSYLPLVGGTLTGTLGVTNIIQAGAPNDASLNLAGVTYGTYSHAVTSAVTSGQATCGASCVDVMGITTPSGLSYYGDRDSVASYAFNGSAPPVVNTSSTTFTGTTVSSSDFSSPISSGAVLTGMIVDAIPSSGAKCSGFVTGASGTTITVSNWYLVDGSGSTCTPASGTKVWVNAQTHVWAFNGLAQLNDGNQATGATGMEIDVLDNRSSSSGDSLYGSVVENLSASGTSATSVGYVVNVSNAATESGAEKRMTIGFEANHTGQAFVAGNYNQAGFFAYKDSSTAPAFELWDGSSALWKIDYLGNTTGAQAAYSGAVTVGGVLYPQAGVSTTGAVTATQNISTQGALESTGKLTTCPAQGSFLTWNQAGGYGETDIVDCYGSGSFPSLAYYYGSTGGVPTQGWSISSTGGFSGTAAMATALASGTLGSIPYQYSSGVTGFVSSPTTTGTYALGWAPTGSAIAPAAITLGTAATVNTGTSGATIPLLNGNNTYSGTSTFSGAVNVSTLTNAKVLGVNSSGVLQDNSSTTLTNSTTGNAATATALASTPTLCSSGYAPTGILANGNATGCAAVSGGAGNMNDGSGTTTVNQIPVSTTTAHTYTLSSAPAISGANLTALPSSTGLYPTLNQSTTGNAATATALASTPTLCSTGYAPTGVLANGNATGCAAIGAGSGSVSDGAGTTTPYEIAYTTSTAHTIAYAGVSGLVWASTSGAPVAASSAQVQSLIGAGVYDAAGAAGARALPGSCGTNQYATATTTGGVSCSQVGYAQVSGTPTLGTAATVNTGTSGATIPLLNGNNTYSGTSTFSGAVTANNLLSPGPSGSYNLGSTSYPWYSVVFGNNGYTQTLRSSGSLAGSHAVILPPDNGADDQLASLKSSQTFTGANSFSGTVALQGAVNVSTLTNAKVLGVNSSGALQDNSSATLTNSTTGNAATATALAATPSQCPTNYFSTGNAANGNANCAGSVYSAGSTGALGNLTGYDPFPGQTSGAAMGWNYTAGSGDVDFFNLYIGAATSFNFYQRTTGLNSFRELLSIDSSGNLTPLTTSSNFFGNASTATALASTPTLCSSGYAPTGILANGNATGCAALGGGSGTVSDGSGTTTSGQAAVSTGTAHVIGYTATPSFSGASLTALPSNTSLYPTLNQNTTGTAANITATSNSTLTTLSALSLPYAQVSGTPTLGTAATVNTGTSGATIPLLNGNNTQSGTQAFTNTVAVSGVPATTSASPVTYTDGPAMFQASGTNGWPTFYLNGISALSAPSSISYNSGGSGSSGGSLAASTYYGSCSGIDASGNVGPATAVTSLTTTTGSTSYVAMTCASVINATGYIYQFGTSSGVNSGSAYSSGTTCVIKSTATGTTGTYGQCGTSLANAGSGLMGMLALSTTSSNPTTWNAQGTLLGINATNGFRGNVLDYHLNGGTSWFSVDSSGALTAANGAIFGGSTSVQGSITASGGGTGSNIISKTTTTASSSTCASPGSYQWLQQVWHGGGSTTNTLSMTPTCTGGTDGATKVTVANSNTASPLTWAVSGFVTANEVGGTTSATLAATAGAGTSPTIGCATSHVCSAMNGTISLTTGTSPASGTLLTISDVTTHTNYPDCMAHIHLASSPAADLPYYFTYSTSVWTLNIDAALTASTNYTITYACLGY